MKKILYAMILLVILTSLTTVGCTRSATKGGGGPEMTSTADIPFPVAPSSNPRMTEIVSATQTAAMQKPTTGLDEKTPVPGDVSTIPAATDEVVQPTAKSIVIVPTATPGKPTTYTLKDGEFPYCIARRFDVNPGDLLAINNIGGNVAPGTTLKIPTDSKWPAEFERSLREHPGTYTVQAGQTIYEIACLYGDADPDAIIVANSLKEPYTLSAGQVLQIP
ncbi:MAG: hypothetical protein BGO78_07040 [Chloroflexi bacterium 44-23]|nr:MAG: hypothetical protein BGO78_07040 [Chloroflexi bacterium 44-23]